MAPIPPTIKISLSTTNAKEKTQSKRVESKKDGGRSLEWDKRVLIVLEKMMKLSLSSSPALSLSLSTHATQAYGLIQTHVCDQRQADHTYSGG